MAVLDRTRLTGQLYSLSFATRKTFKMILKTEEFYKAADELIAAGRFIDNKGWVPATSGNFSARLDDGNIAITVSGKHKGNLQCDDIMIINGDGYSLDGKKPSAETQLHTMLYRLFPQVRSVLHPHTVNSVLLSRLCAGEVVLEDYELLKALSGINTHEARITIPIFDNDQNIPRLAGAIERYIDKHTGIRGYVIASHGFYTWGTSVGEALRHLETQEFLFDCEVRLKGMNQS